MDAKTYNYTAFTVESNGTAFDTFTHALHVSDPAPDGEMVDIATGQTVRLSDFWKTRPVVIEFGSYT